MASSLDRYKVLWSYLMKDKLSCLNVLQFDSFVNSPWGTVHRNRQGNVQTRTFEPTKESADYWSAAYSYNFIIRVK